MGKCQQVFGAGNCLLLRNWLYALAIACVSTLVPNTWETSWKPPGSPLLTHWERVPLKDSLDGLILELLRKPRLFIRVLQGLLLFQRATGLFFCEPMRVPINLRRVPLPQRQ